jgi:hypothetical protein
MNVTVAIWIVVVSFAVTLFVIATGAAVVALWMQDWNRGSACRRGCTKDSCRQGSTNAPAAAEPRAGLSKGETRWL